MKNIVLVLGIVVLVVVGLMSRIPQDKGKSSPPPEGSTPPQSSPSAPAVSLVAENLDTPWGIAFLPDRSMLATERPGRVRVVSPDGSLQQTPVATLNAVKEIGEGGLLGIALHPDFSSNHDIYLYYTYESSGNKALNRVVRMKYEDGNLKDEQLIVDKIPGAPNHNGGRIKFGPDHLLYMTTGDAQEPSQAQDTNSLAGKILRVTDSGEPAPGNPFNNLVYSYGHRNPQGLAWDGSGRLWATEHGRSGVLSGLDELNLIESGKNYGWPTIQGNETRAGMETPRLHSGSATWAPAGLAFVGESLFFGGLRGQTLYEVSLKGNQLALKEHCNERVVSSVDRARKRNCAVEVVAGPGASEKSVGLWRSLGIPVYVLDQWPERHFAIVDGKHVRVEEPHRRNEERRVQYVVHNYGNVDQLKGEYEEKRTQAKALAA